MELHLGSDKYEDYEDEDVENWRSPLQHLTRTKRKSARPMLPPVDAIPMRRIKIDSFSDEDALLRRGSTLRIIVGIDWGGGRGEVAMLCCEINLKFKSI